MALPQLANTSTWMQIAGAFAVSIFFQFLSFCRDMILAAIADPAVGPKQVMGYMDASQFRLEATVEEDPNCFAKMREIVNAISQNIWNRGIVSSDIVNQPRSLNVTQVDTLTEVNNGRSCDDYGKADNTYALLNDNLKLAPDEVIIDVCPANPVWKFMDYVKCVVTLGGYYVTDMDATMGHRTNVLFTNKRIIQHSVLLNKSQPGNITCDHSRLDFWVVDKLNDLAVIDFQGEVSFRAESESFGPIAVPISANLTFMVKMFRCMFHPRIPTEKIRGLTKMERAEWFSDPLFTDSTFTAQALLERESIDVAVNYDQRKYTCFDQVLNCGRVKVPKTTLTSTDECLYLESYTKNGFGKVVSLII